MYEILTHVATIVLTTLVVEHRRWIMDFISRLISSTPQVDRFEELLKRTSYRKDPVKRPHCYIREDYLAKSGERPTFHFYDYLTAKFFERIYYQPIFKILHECYHFNLPLVEEAHAQRAAPAG